VVINKLTVCKSDRSPQHQAPIMAMFTPPDNLELLDDLQRNINNVVRTTVDCGCCRLSSALTSVT
jgi:hypothetical protein